MKPTPLSTASLLVALCVGCGGDSTPRVPETTPDGGTSAEDSGPGGPGGPGGTGGPGGPVDNTCISGAVSALVAQGDKLLVAGQSNADVLVARYGRDGALDTTFAAGGVLREDLGGSGEGLLAKKDDGALGLHVTADNLWVAGFGRGTPGGGESSFALLKLTSNGARDPSFGDEGLRLLDVGTTARFHNVHVDEAGRPWAAGWLEDGSGADLVVARFTPQGPLDSSFPEGPDNGAILDSGGDERGLFALFTPAGLVAGGNATLTRVSDAGVRDDAFGDAGWFESAGGGVQGLLAREGGKILVAGIVTDEASDARNVLRLTQLTADGQPDPAFGTNGTLELAYDLTILEPEEGEPFDGSLTFVRGLQPTADGGVLIYTSIIGVLNNRPALLRIAADGSKVTDFGSDGMLILEGELPLLQDLARPGGASLLFTDEDEFWVADELVERESICVRVRRGAL